MGRCWCTSRRNTRRMRNPDERRVTGVAWSKERQRGEPLAATPTPSYSLRPTRGRHSTPMSL